MTITSLVVVSAAVLGKALASEACQGDQVCIDENTLLQGLNSIRQHVQPSKSTPSLQCAGIHEAEDASNLEGAHVHANTNSRGHQGFTGESFVDYTSSDGAIEWNIEHCRGGAASVSFRYALRGGDRPLKVEVNNQVVQASLSFPRTGSWATWGDSASVQIPLVAGTNKIRLVGTGQSGANLDSMTLIPTSLQCEGVHEAEDASNLEGAHVHANTNSRGHQGFTGESFVDYTSSDGAIEWNIAHCRGGAASVSFRYALLGGNRPLKVEVNNQVVQASLSFPRTGSWATWGDSASVQIPLVAGTNKIRLVGTGQSGANLDSMTLIPVGCAGEPQTKGNNGNGITSSGGPDGASAIQFIDLGAGAFEHAGEMRSVRYHVSRANQAAQKFQIYRLVSGNTYHLVSETEALASTQAGSIVTQEFQTPLQFQEGDFIGWVHTGRGTFPYRGGGGSVRWRYGIQGVGSDINFNGAGARIYAYEVAYAACSAPVIVFDQASPSLTVSPGTLSGTGQLSWNTAANSALQVSQGDNICGISFKCNSADSHLMIGLAHTEVTRWRDLDYGVTCRGAWAAATDIYENGGYRNRLSNRNANGSPASDVHAIRVNGDGQVEYSVNGDVYFTSSRPVTYPWHVGVDTYTSPSLADAEYLSCDA